MPNVTRLPVRFKYPRTVDGREIWGQVEPPDEMVWEICPYVGTAHLEGCEHCPKFEWDEECQENIQRGCYGLAQEACRIVFAMLKRLK